MNTSTQPVMKTNFAKYRFRDVVLKTTTIETQCGTIVSREFGKRGKGVRITKKRRFTLNN